MPGANRGLAGTLLPWVLLLAGCGEPTAPPPAATPAPAAAPSTQASARGADLYRKHCQACHGERGIGDGPLGVFLLPRPRNFVAAKYRITSTLQREPTDDDLLATLRRGFPGTAMPSFGHLPEGDLRALVEQVKSFAATPIRADADPSRPDATGPIPVPAEPKDDAASRERGRELYAMACASCHGTTGRGDGRQEQRDDMDMPTWPRDFSSGEWKGGSSGIQVYRRIVGGLAGSPMPSFDTLAGDDAWHLVHWIRSQSDLDEEGRNEQRRVALRASRTAAAPPLDPADAAWAGAKEQWVALMPLWMRRTPRIRGLHAAALTDGRSVALRLRWEDATRDDSTFGQREFRDGVAVQVTADPDPPFFGMGGGETPGKGPSVAIWMWKADRQADAGGARDLPCRFPDMAADGYPAAVEKDRIIVPGLPARDHDPRYLSGRAAGNQVSDLSGERPAESLSAKGAGTVGFRKGGAPVEARGEWKDGAWSVVIRRSLADDGAGAVPLDAAGRASVAFALWNGSDGDRNGTKSVTIWHDLLLEEASR